MQEFTHNEIPLALGMILDRLARVENLLADAPPPASHTNERQWLNMKEAEQYLGMTKLALYGLINRRKIPHSKVGRRITFNRELLEKWLRDGDRSTVESMGEKGVQRAVKAMRGATV